MRGKDKIIEFAKFSNTVIFLEGKGNEQVDKYKVYGGKIRWVFDLNLSDGFEDFEKYYNAKK